MISLSSDEKKEKKGGAFPKRKKLRKLRSSDGEMWLLGTVKGLLKDADLVRETTGKVSPAVIALTCNPAEARTLRTIARKRPEGYNLRKADDVQALAALMWAWECRCGKSNDPETLKCSCGRPAPEAEKSRISGRATEGGRSVHAAADNVWAETSAPPPYDDKEPRFGIGDVLTHHDEIYMSLLLAFGEARFPSPAFLAAVGAAGKGGPKAIGIDMEEEAFSDLHVSSVGYLDLMRSSRMVRVIEKKGLRADTPEEYVLEWDRRLMKIDGYTRVEIARAKYMARRVKTLAAKRGKVLLVCEFERMEVLTEALKAQGFHRERV